VNTAPGNVNLGEDAIAVHKPMRWVVVRIGEIADNLPSVV
jgi:hypothetical protein